MTRETFELVPLAGGGHSLRSLANGQTFHPVVGPVAEAMRLHVGGTRLIERANALPPGRMPVIWDVGLGAAANALAAVRALAADYQRTEDALLFSFDRDLAALEFALAHAAELDYPRGYETALRALLDHGETFVPIGRAGVRWRVMAGDFAARLADAPSDPSPDAIFHDPYSPTANPEMWTLELFTALRARLRNDVPCLLTTYTRSTAVRVTLLLAGCHVGIGPSRARRTKPPSPRTIPRSSNALSRATGWKTRCTPRPTPRRCAPDHRAQRGGRSTRRISSACVAIRNSRRESGQAGSHAPRRAQRVGVGAGSGPMGCAGQ